MNEKINIRHFAEIIANSNGLDVEETHVFVKELFSVIGQSLINRENVNLESFGEFSIVDNIDDPVRFTPDGEFAAKLNAPFALFTPAPIEGNVNAVDLTIEEDVVESMSDIEVVSESIKTENDSVETDVKEQLNEPIAQIADENEQAEVVTPDVEPIMESDNSKDEHTGEFDAVASDYTLESEIKTTETKPQSSVELIITEQPIVIEEDEDEIVNIEYPQKSKFKAGFIVGLLVGLMIGALALFGYLLYFTNQLTQNI